MTPATVVIFCLSSMHAVARSANEVVPPAEKPGVTATSTELRVSSEAPQVYCGLYCVYAAAQLLDMPVDFDEILRPENLTGEVGSSAKNLLAVLEELELRGALCQFMPVERLGFTNHPVILHVRPPGMGNTYSHWALFLGFDGDLVRLYDPPRAEGSISVAELLSIWDGTAIVVTKKDSIGTAFASDLPVAFSTIALVVLGSTLVITFSRSRRSWFVVAVPAISLSIVVHLLLPSGFLRSWQSVGSVQASFFHSDLPIIGFAETEKLIVAGDCCVVDARPNSAYNAFHLPDAINIPIDSGCLELARGVSAIKRRRMRHVVVYCQSTSCDWSERMASQLVMRGVQNVFVYKGGVNEWRSKVAQVQ